jgi:hypothetical protein
MKKQQLDMEEEKWAQQNAAQKLGADRLRLHVADQERARSRQTKKGDGKQPAKKALKIKEEKYRVKKHSVDKKDGTVRAQIQLGDRKEVWVTLDEIWEPGNIALYLPAWREYCDKRSLPPDWGGENGGRVSGKDESISQPVGEDGSIGEGDAESGTMADTKLGVKDQPVGENKTGDEAVCYGHELDEKGRVNMFLRWTDTGEESYAWVGKVMRNKWERMHLGNTWFEYCDANSLNDNLFRMEGLSKVMCINGHEWGNDGRPVAVVKWNHGEISKAVVKNAIEKNDCNGFFSAWKAYCDGIVGGVDEKMYKGNVVKAHVSVVENGLRKKRRRFN